MNVTDIRVTYDDDSGSTATAHPDDARWFVSDVLGWEILEDYDGSSFMIRGDEDDLCPLQPRAHVSHRTVSSEGMTAHLDGSYDYIEVDD